ncbi:hypothetical protein COA01_33225 [Bacillus cereus]|uniref:vWA domain-containing protein n=1 Tax=Bacillus cereus TaxID=1396 RepID=UPI000BFCA57A|nr:VWA domain-containing protein [Bacillus cereus]PGP12682.1 hypothetical protein COA01_33225 [Bacillus cereus]
MLQLKFAKSMMENEEGMNHLHIRVNPEETLEKVEKPVAFFLVIDSSSSMNDSIDGTDDRRYINGVFNKNHYEGNTKLDYVKQASEKLIDMMKDGDMLGIVSFSSVAKREYDLTTLNKNERYAAKDRIRALVASGMTNVSDGLEEAYKQIPKELTKTHHIKIMLASDGVANYGITNDDGIATLVNEYRKNEISVSTIGVGLDYNSYFMEVIATASGGMFYHLEKMEQLNDILTKELETLSTLNTKQAKVIITTPEDIKVSSNLNGYAEDKKGEIFLGNLFNGLDVLIELFTEEEIEVGNRIVNVRYEYINAKGVKNAIEQEIVLNVVHEDDMDEVETDKEVVELVKKLVEAKTKKEALRHYEVGNMDVLRGNLQNTYNDISRLSESYGFDAENMVSDMKTFETTVMTRSINKADMKTMYMENYSLMSNKSKQDK